MPKTITKFRLIDALNSKAEGMTVLELAERLDMSPRGVRFALQAVEKLGHNVVFTEYKYHPRGGGPARYYRLALLDVESKPLPKRDRKTTSAERMRDYRADPEKRARENETRKVRRHPVPQPDILTAAFFGLAK